MSWCAPSVEASLLFNASEEHHEEGAPPHSVSAARLTFKDINSVCSQRTLYTDQSWISYVGAIQKVIQTSCHHSHAVLNAICGLFAA